MYLQKYKKDKAADTSHLLDTNHAEKCLCIVFFFSLPLDGRIPTEDKIHLE